MKSQASTIYNNERKKQVEVFMHAEIKEKELKNIELETVERIFEFLLGDSYKSTEE